MATKAKKTSTSLAMIDTTQVTSVATTSKRSFVEKWKAEENSLSALFNKLRKRRSDLTQMFSEQAEAGLKVNGPLIDMIVNNGYLNAFKVFLTDTEKEKEEKGKHFTYYQVVGVAIRIARLSNEKAYKIIQESDYTDTWISRYFSDIETE